MRITTANAYEASIDNMQRRQRELADSQSQLTSGKRVQRASDDPTAAALAERALATVSRTEASERALQASRNAMTLTEGALADATELTQQVREALIAAGNAAYSDSERAGVAQRLTALRQQLLTVSNRADGAGGFLFAGQGSDQAPFVDAAGGVQFRGVNGELQVASGEPLPLTTDGAAAWLQARSGNGVFETRAIASTTAWIDAGRVTDPAQITSSTYSVQFSVAAGVTTYSILRDGLPTAVTNAAYASGQAIQIDGMSFSVNGTPANGDQFETVPSSASLSIFDTLDSAIAELGTNGRTGAQVTQTAQRALRDIDQSLFALQSLRSRVGESLNRADGVEGRLQAMELYGKTERSNAEDLDMVEAISDFQNRQSGYDAALKTYSMVQRMSLFQYLQG